MGSFLVFLVMLLPNTEKPVMALMMSFPTVKECQVILDRAPADQRGEFACIKIDLKPEPEKVSL